MKKIIAMDIGSSAIKACVYGLDSEEIKLLYSCTVNIGLYSPKPGYAEHNPDEVWSAFCEATNKIFASNIITNEEVCCVSLCSQAQCVVLVDEFGNTLTPIYNSQDTRATETFKKYFSGIINVDGVSVFKALKCYLASGFMPGSAKDPVFKYKWVEDNLPQVYEKAYKWLDIKDYIICRLTGEFITTKDNAHAYTIYNSKENKGNWSKIICKLFKVDTDKLPKVIDSTDIVGEISESTAKQTGLAVGTAVIGGIIDSSGVQYGSGAVDVGESMVYWGTSGWVGTVLDKMKIDLISRTGALIAAENNKFHYYACLDSAGISYRWLKEHVVENDGILSEKNYIKENENYKYMNKALINVPIGSEGLMYAPWITGCRAPMEASDIGGMFLNIKINMNKKHFIKAVAEGICYHYRLLSEVTAKKITMPNKIRFVGGGAESDEISQILADITGCVVEVPEHPQDVGALGAAIVGFYAIGDKEKTLVETAHMQKAEKTFLPNEENHNTYNKYYEVYKKLYKSNNKLLKSLTKINDGQGEKI